MEQVNIKSDFPLQSFAEWKNRIEITWSKINYREFCLRAGFAEDGYSEHKWQQWQQLIKGLSAFDAATLESIITDRQ